MAHQKSRKGNRQARTVSWKSRRPILVLLLAVIGLSVAAGLFYWNRKGSNFEKPASLSGKPRTEAITAQKVAQDLPKLIGRWVRPNGGYVIKIRSISSDGRLDASYLNPRPINVARAEARGTGKDLSIFLELQDVGYPGSTYTLSYDEGRDMLYGSYFQAAMGQTFDVIFVRMNP